MATQVVKSNGDIENFNAIKIIGAISRAAKDALLAPEEINSLVGVVSDKVILAVEEKDKISSDEIRDMVLTELDVLNPRVAAEWRLFIAKNSK
jgi:transcriptional regulator NrdR family protein